ncbi:MAG: hypothetical protein WD273_12265 [Trueperaceae bacterium]
MLAMAFRAHQPAWGSQGTLLALGLTEFLNYIDWHLDLAETLLSSWLEDAQKRMDDNMLDLRLNQIQYLVDTATNPRNVALQVDPDHTHPALAELLCALANAGVMERDLRGLKQAGKIAIAEQLEKPELNWLGDSAKRQLAQSWNQVRGLGAEDSLNALRKDDRDLHPTVLQFQVTKHVHKISYALDTRFLDGKGPQA